MKEEEKEKNWPGRFEATYIGTATRTTRRWKRYGGLSLFGKAMARLNRIEEARNERQLKRFIKSV